MPPIPGMVHWHSLLARHVKSLKTAVQRASKALDAQLAGRSQAQLEPILVRNTAKHPLHKFARIRQSQSRWYSTARGSLEATVRHFSTGVRSGSKFDRASLPKSRVSAQIAQSSGRAPFASTLRPSLTGGTLGRTAGGYTLGSGRIGGARHFSHGPAAQAQVVQNVSQAVRAFFISGQKAQFDGVSPTTGEKRYKAVTSLQEETGRKIRSIPHITPGSWINFAVNPTITALTPLAGLSGFSSTSSTESVDHLNTDGLINVLSVDFSRALKDLAAVLNDLKRLSALGDLPITYEDGSLRVHFPGCDSDTVERMCAELNITRGTVTQDEAFDAFAGTEIALLFPFAPSENVSECESLFEYEPAPHKHSSFIHLEDMLTPSESAEDFSIHSDSGLEDVLAEDPWLSDPSGFESIRSGSDSQSDSGKGNNPLEYQGLEGIYRFLEQCDAVRR